MYFRSQVRLEKQFKINARKLFPNAKLVGCDLSETFLRHGWRLSETLKLNIKFKQALAEQTKEKDNSYDAVISYAFFHELPVKAGIKIITDPLSILAETLDFEFTVKGTGLLRRLQRFTAVLKNKKIENLYFEKERGVCDMTSAQNVLKDID